MFVGSYHRDPEQQFLLVSSQVYGITEPTRDYAVVLTAKHCVTVNSMLTSGFSQSAVEYSGSLLSFVQ